MLACLDSSKSDLKILKVLKAAKLSAYIQASDQAVSSVKAVPHIALPKVVDLHLCAKALVKSPAAHNFPRSQEMVEVLCLVGDPRRPWLFQPCLICLINYDRYIMLDGQ